MQQFDFIIGATFVAQAGGAALLALLLLSFYRQYRKEYLRQWTLSWTTLAIYHLAAIAGLALTFTLRLPARAPSRLAIAAIGGAAGYLQIVWLAFGAWELVKRRPVRLLTAQRFVIAAIVLGVLTALPFTAPASSPALRFALRVSLRALVGGAVFMTVSALLWRHRRRREGVGFSIFAVALLAYAIEQLHYFVLGSIWITSGVYREYTMYLGYLDFILQAVVGIGMIACLLEDEREAAELASIEIEHLAYHDALTGLPNRPLFYDRLILAVAQAARTGQKLAVFFCDLDRFKDINDSLGHSVGDTLLKAVADRIRRCIREGDTIARFGGDEFTLLIPRIDSVEDAAKIAQKIIETLKIPFFVGERELFVSTSIGISIYPTDGLDAETLVRNADTAMYRAKEQGRDSYQLYAPAMNAQALERLALENMLRKALAQKELVVYYQPLIDARTQRILGLEALVRWNHPELGLLSPAHFISAAELSGLIIPIGSWVLTDACRQVRQWHKRLNLPLTISVNLSARQFQQPDLVQQIRAALEETGLDACYLELEITESNAMQNAENTIYTLRELKNLGVRISMDDFGTGYSSLNYLKRFPIDTLKLDQSFVREVTTDRSDAAIVSAVITMAHSLQLAVVAEGVETEDQLAFLQRQGCDRIQGFLYSPPVSAADLEAMVSGRDGGKMKRESVA